MIKYFPITIICILVVLIIISAVLPYINYLGKENIGSAINITAEAQIQTTTRTNYDNDTEETISTDANNSRLDGSQPNSSPIQGTGIPNEQTSANPAPQAPISGMEIRTRENETREGTGAFADFTNTTK
ncbi:MAG: hypothetical protein M3297_07555 [Thermoproteota archaeon]|nr:hypothetical protein [Thermoproteota archaeon]